MTFGAILKEIVGSISYRQDYSLRFSTDSAGWFLQLDVWRRDSVTGEYGWGHSPKAHVSDKLSRSDIVRTAFGLCKAYEEHETREFFKYKGVRVFSPHQDVEALVAMGQAVDIEPVSATIVVCPSGTDHATRCCTYTGHSPSHHVEPHVGCILR